MTSYLRTVTVLVALAGFTALSPPVVMAQLELQRPSRLYLHVTDQRGATVTDLRSDEIVVHANGRLRKVLSATPANLPSTITVLVDNSSVARDTTMRLRETLKGFFSGLPRNQRVSLLAVSGQPRWVVRPTTKLDELLAGTDRLVPGQSRSTRFFDALIEATQRVTEDEARHRALIVSFTAVGGDQSTFTRGRYQRFLRTVVETGVTFHTLQLNNPFRRSMVALQAQVAEDLQRATGGYHRKIAVGSGVGDAFEEILEIIVVRERELARQIVVHYEPLRGADEPLEELSIELLRPDLSLGLSLDGRLP